MIIEAYERGFADALAAVLTELPGYRIVEVGLPLKSPGFVIRNPAGEVFFVGIRHLDRLEAP